MKKTLTNIASGLVVGATLILGAGCESSGDDPEVMDAHRVHTPALSYEFLSQAPLDALNLVEGDGVNDNGYFRDFATEQEAKTYINDNKSRSKGSDEPWHD